MNKHKTSRYEKSSSRRRRSPEDNAKWTSKKEYFETQGSDESKVNKPGTSNSKPIFLKSTDPEFPWVEHRSTLNKIFFNDRGKIKR